MAERRRNPAPLPELLDDWDPKAFRRVRRDEGAGDAPICPDCQSPLQPNPYNHLPSCAVRVRDGRPWRPHEAADEANRPLLLAAPVALPQSQEPPAQSQESTPVITPEVMPPAAPVAQAVGAITLDIEIPAGVPLNIRIRQGGAA